MSDSGSDWIGFIAAADNCSVRLEAELTRQLGFPGSLQLPVRLLGQLVGAGLLDLAPQLNDRLVPGVRSSDGSESSRQFE